MNEEQQQSAAASAATTETTATAQSPKNKNKGKEQLKEGYQTTTTAAASDAATQSPSQAATEQVNEHRPQTTATGAVTTPAAGAAEAARDSPSHATERHIANTPTTDIGRQGAPSTTTASSSSTSAFVCYAIKKSSLLEGPAIFMKWKDAEKYLYRRTNARSRPSEYEFQSFNKLQDAVLYLFSDQAASINISTPSYFCKEKKSAEEPDRYSRTSAAGKASSKEKRKHPSSSSSTQLVGMPKPPPPAPPPPPATTTGPSPIRWANQNNMKNLGIVDVIIPEEATGKLGFELEGQRRSDGTYLTYVRFVHTRSALYGLLFGGDIIVKINGKDVSTWRVSDIAPELAWFQPISSNNRNQQPPRRVIQVRRATVASNIYLRDLSASARQNNDQIAHQRPSKRAKTTPSLPPPLPPPPKSQPQTTIMTTGPAQNISKLSQDFISNFEKFFNKLKQFKEEYGDTDVPTRRALYIVTSTNASTSTEDGSQLDLTANHIDQNKYDCLLGRFVAQMRKQIQSYETSPEMSLLTRNQVRNLQYLDFCMKPKRGVDRSSSELRPAWNEKRFEELKAFSDKYGHCAVPIQPKSGLRDWVDRVLLAYRDLHGGVVATITNDQIQRLQQLGMDWRDKRHLTFEESVERCRVYVSENDGKYPSSHSRLGNWVSRTRRKYAAFMAGEKLSANITQTQINLLNAWGFEWESTSKHANKSHSTREIKPKTFEERLEELKAYKEEYGDCLVPQIYPGLGSWAHGQKRDYKTWKEPKVLGRKSPMTEERYQKLLEIGFVFDKQPGGPRFNKQKFSGNAHRLGTQNLNKLREKRRNQNNA